MAQVSYQGNLQIHPSEAVEVSGITESGREISVYLTNKSIEQFTRAILFSQAHNNSHLGHAFWHVEHDTDNQDGFKSCWMCQEDQKIKAME